MQTLENEDNNTVEKAESTNSRGIFWVPIWRSLGWSFEATEEEGAPLLEATSGSKTYLDNYWALM